MKHALYICGIGGVALVSGAATAGGFDGQTLTAEWLYPNMNTVLESHDVVVGSGVELNPEDIIFDDDFLIDISDDLILFEFNSDGIWTKRDFNGWRFTDTNGTVPEIIGYTIEAMSGGISGLDQGDLDFNANSVWGNFRGVIHSGASDFILLRVTFIPGPTPIAALSLAALLCPRGRRRRS